MPVAITLIVGVVVLTIALVGIVWAMLVLVPFYAYLAIAIYLMWRSNRKHAELSEAIQREAERQRLFNEQEMRAWRRVIETEDRAASTRGGAETSHRTNDKPPAGRL